MHAAVPRRVERLPSPMTGPANQRASGTEGYAEAAEALAQQYESVSIERAYGSLMHMLPSPPADILDIGSGTGRDAAAFAERGHRVVAVEPTLEFRRIAQRLHPSSAIAWLDDSLPELARLSERQGQFDLVSLIAVWMHLDPWQRARAMPRVAALLRPCGLLVMSLRHGPVPAGRRMFEVGAEETCRLAAGEGLTLMHHGTGRDMLGRAGVSWTMLAFRRGDGYAT
jgi:SAM-dependent methyltransferase